MLDALRATIRVLMPKHGSHVLRVTYRPLQFEAMYASFHLVANKLPATVERNVFVNSVALQNRGYAYMPIP